MYGGVPAHFTLITHNYVNIYTSMAHGLHGLLKFFSFFLSVLDHLTVKSFELFKTALSHLMNLFGTSLSCRIESYFNKHFRMLAVILRFK